ncbi:MAG: four helix bundle protein [Steroidobacteraceae bacterium]
MELKVLKDFRNLEAWQKAFSLAANIYTETAQLPASEAYGMASQLRRCAVSVASNIAEGSNHRTTKEFVKYLFIARGWLAEMETQILLSGEIGLIANIGEHLAAINEVGRLLNGLIRSLPKKTEAGMART